MLEENLLSNDELLEMKLDMVTKKLKVAQLTTTGEKCNFCEELHLT
jgi:hypothetical protein